MTPPPSSSPAPRTGDGGAPPLSHIALGQAYRKCFVDGDTLDEAGFTARGGNSSLIHVDWMIGSGALDVDGIAADGTAEALMRKGEWAI